MLLNIFVCTALFIVIFWTLKYNIYTFLVSTCTSNCTNYYLFTFLMKQDCNTLLLNIINILLNNIVLFIFITIKYDFNCLMVFFEHYIWKCNILVIRYNFNFLTLIHEWLHVPSLPWYFKTYKSSLIFHSFLSPGNWSEIFNIHKTKYVIRFYFLRFTGCLF